MAPEPLVRVENLVCDYRTQTAVRRQTIRAVDRVDLDVAHGELLALVGESGSGKSTLGRAIVRLIRPTGGRILFEGRDIASFRGSRLRAYRGDAQVVFQNPYQSLNPHMIIGDALGEVLRVWRRRRAITSHRTPESLLEDVHLPAEFADKFPHELSGGQRQRVAIARAMAVEPKLLVADEPVSALDVSSSATVLNLLLELRKATGLTCIFVTHDIGLARLIADRIAVMYRGVIVEVGEPEAMFSEPHADYTRALIGAQLHIVGAD